MGSAVNGLRMSIAITSGPNSEMRITARNVDDRPLLLLFGTLMGPRMYDFKSRPIVTVPGGKDLRVIYVGAGGVVAGRLDPFVVPLLPNAT